ncbi:hypothetical protein Glove_109g204 [Diversispora epigaea]|uniref:Uncharacterized protein n=1 Tax=Diversispora epigaea TaxID=1348612 RepID=A0A397J213_9GLOM|nr:hypothetical protein Glove_109g204 [Diversispora epigaea]
MSIHRPHHLCPMDLELDLAGIIYNGYRTHHNKKREWDCEDLDAVALKELNDYRYDILELIKVVSSFMLKL